MLVDFKVDAASQCTQRPQHTNRALQPRTCASQQARQLAHRYLAQTLGFSACSAATLERLVGGGHLKVLAKDEHLIHNGEPFDMLAVIVDGALNFSQMRMDGQRYLLGVQMAGDTVGYVPMVDGSLYPYDTCARSPGTQVLLIPGAHVRQERLRDPGIGRAIELQLAYRMRMAYAKLNRDTGQAIDIRLASTLVLWAKRYGIPRSGTLVIEQKVSQDDFADILGSSRQRINFALRKLKEARLIALRYGCIVILDLDKLIEFASDKVDMSPALSPPDFRRSPDC
ncbi:Crp/Fnr family transcriptional regulator [Roseateles koreensis]|uniref:Crp/Fnr family transcriptional regulator n=1 Tax=Roseateles koreensis TaxID=2987526 RepID=A0ABT5KR35_9BURK|nr:Crp/Fnr family transcriptional regulator [Roseateles koreensis]MDC8784925.1 Crp/Fnr family transcriptional regulator [Roseateles koreensis]